ncbi:MAG: threonine--tRNA ligase, partial [Gemmatimonadota bacterium]|nr:threonine--tRNA ligase [Gemmatimonadota bacterium]
MIDQASEDLQLTLPDGSVRAVPYGTIPRDVIASIGERLLRAALAVTLNGKVQDVMTPMRESGSFRVITEREPKDAADRAAVDEYQRAHDVLRHSAAHILATAVRRLRPDAKIGFGPSIEDGFYYDFEVAQPFTPDDLAAFESEMKKVVAEKYPFVREEVNRTEAQKRFVDDPLKLERLSELGDGEVISIYTDGPFIDLCRGPHVQDTSYLK